MADHPEPQGNGNQRREIPRDIVIRNEEFEWLSIRNIVTVLIVAVAFAVYSRVGKEINDDNITTPTFPPPKSSDIDDSKVILPNSNYDTQNQGKRPTSGMNPYEAEAAAMKRIITRYASMQKADLNNNTGSSFLGKTSGTFVLETEPDESSNEKLEPLDSVDLEFVDNMIHDIQETEESKDKLELEERVNELETQVGRKLTKYRMTPEELDADTSLGDDKRQYFEFLNVRQGFVETWRARLQELKKQDYKRYFRHPEDYTMEQKVILLKKHFDEYVKSHWDNELKKQKRTQALEGGLPSSPPSSTTSPNEASHESSFEADIDDILDEIYYTTKYRQKQELEEELRELKSLQGHPSPKVDEKEHIRFNFITLQRDSLSYNEKPLSDYTETDRKAMVEAWKEYFEHHYENYRPEDGDELDIYDLDHLDELINEIERTPNYFERERERKKMERWQNQRKNRYSSSSRNTDLSRKRSTDDFVQGVLDRFEELQKLEKEFIKEEQARLGIVRIKAEKRPALKRPKEKLNSPESENDYEFDPYEKYYADDDDYEDLDEFDFLREFREPIDYSLREKVELKKRYDLFRRRHLASKTFDPMPETLTKSKEEALKNNQLDYLDDLIEDIHGLSTPAVQARLAVESFVKKQIDAEPNNREGFLRYEELMMRRKFISQERARWVTELTASKTPNDYTYDEKEELRCRWVYFYNKYWRKSKQDELKQLVFKRTGKQPVDPRRNRKEDRDFGNLFNEFEAELVNDLIDEIFDLHDFSHKQQLMLEADKETLTNWRLKEQLIRQQKLNSVSAEEKIISEFGKNSLAEFLSMKNTFILNEKVFFKEKNLLTARHNLNRNDKKKRIIELSPTETLELMNRWNIAFEVYKNKVDTSFQKLGT